MRRYFLPARLAITYCDGCARMRERTFDVVEGVDTVCVWMVRAATARSVAEERVSIRTSPAGPIPREDSRRKREAIADERDGGDREERLGRAGETGSGN